MQMFYHAAIAFFIGVILWLLLPALTGVDWLIDGVNNRYWQDINQYTTLIVAVTFGASALVLIPSGSKKPRRRKKTKE